VTQLDVGRINKGIENLASFLSDLTCHKMVVNMMVNKYDNKMCVFRKTQL